MHKVLTTEDRSDIFVSFSALNININLYFMFYKDVT